MFSTFRKIRRPRLVIVLGFLCFALAGVKLTEMMTGTSVFVRFGGTVWIPVNGETGWLPEGVKVALATPEPIAEAGEFEWLEAAPGFEVATIPIISKGVEVDQLLLARIDPHHYRFEVHNDPSGKKGLKAWMNFLPALLVVNGSYYDRDGRPATPSVLNNRIDGPKTYEATHGAFVSSASGAHVVDLGEADWASEFEGMENAFVSYPLLLSPEGESRVDRDSGWLANRSFIAEDAGERIIVGSTRGSFFSLYRLAEFLGSGETLNLKIALNLDGGPVACQGIRVSEFRRMHCGQMELQTLGEGKAKVLPSSVIPGFKAPMPIVIAVYPTEHNITLD